MPSEDNIPHAKVFGNHITCYNSNVLPPTLVNSTLTMSSSVALNGKPCMRTIPCDTVDTSEEAIKERYTNSATHIAETIITVCHQAK